MSELPKLYVIQFLLPCELLKNHHKHNKQIQKHLKKSNIYKKVIREISEGSQSVYGKSVESIVFAAFFYIINTILPQII